MSTPVIPTNTNWLRQLLTGRPHMVVGGEHDPYLLRWYIIPRNPTLNIYLHKFLRSDDDRALHDHPWWFLSLMLRGQYDEVTDTGVTRRRTGSIAFRRAEWRHRVQLLPTLTETGRDDQRPTGPLIRLWRTVELPCWTLIITGRRVRTWGFWCREFRGNDGLATNQHTDEHGNELPHAGERFIKWDEFGDAGCGETE